MISNSGIVVDPGMDSAPNLKDIAIGMCRVTRYAGGIWCPLSVHSILTAEMVFQKTENHRTWAYGLLHDSHEVVTGEILRAWKPKDMKEREKEIDGRILPTFGLSRRELEELSSDIRYADEKALCLEATILGLPGFREYYTKVNNHPPIEPSAWDIAFANLLFKSEWMEPESILLGSYSIAMLESAFHEVNRDRFQEARDMLSGPLIKKIPVEAKKSVSQGAV